MDRIIELQRICIRRFRTIALVLAVGLPLVFVLAHSQEQVHEAEARILLEHQLAAGPYLPNWDVPTDDPELRSRDLTVDPAPGAAADGTGGHHRGPRSFFQFAPEIAAAKAARRLLLIERRITQNDTLENLIAKTGILAGRDDLTPDEKIGLVRSAIEIMPITLAELDTSGDSRVRTVFAVRVRWEDTETASRIANEIVAGVLDRHVSRRTGQTRQAPAFFRQAQHRRQRKIAELEEEIARFREEPRGSPPEGKSFLHDELARLNEVIRDLDQKLLELEAERLSIRIQLSGPAESRAPGAETQEEETILRHRLESLAQKIRLIEDRKASVYESRRKLTESLKRTRSIESPSDRLNRRLMDEKELLDAITRKLPEGGARLNLDQRGERFKVLQHATVPHVSVVNDRQSILVLGAILVFAVAIGLAVLIDRARPRVRSAAEIERLLGVRPLVSLPHVARRPERRRRWSSQDAAAA